MQIHVKRLTAGVIPKDLMTPRRLLAVLRRGAGWHLEVVLSKACRGVGLRLFAIVFARTIVIPVDGRKMFC